MPHPPAEFQFDVAGIDTLRERRRAYGCSSMLRAKRSETERLKPHVVSPAIAFR
jgi:hypothetical protein